MIKNLVLLSACNFCGFLTLFVNLTISDAISSALISGCGAPSWYASLPYGIFVASAATVIGVAGFTAKKFGYRVIFISGALIGLVGGLLCLSVMISSLSVISYPLSLSLFIVGYFLQGCSYGITNYYRHAAALLCKSNENARSRSVANIVIVGLLAGILGPGLSAILKFAVSQNIANICLTSLVLVSHVGHVILNLFMEIKTDSQGISDKESENNVAKKFGKFRFLSLVNLRYAHACITGTVSQGIMTFCMTVTPLALRNKVDAVYISVVISAHAIFMFLPSFITHLVIRKFGADLAAFFGNIVGAIGVIIFALMTNQDPWKRFTFVLIALLFVGVSWNFAFISSTVLLAGCYPDIRFSKFLAQALNDTCLFGLGGGLALSAGVLLENESALLYAFIICALLYLLTAIFNCCTAWNRIRRYNRTIVPTNFLTDLHTEQNETPNSVIRF